jgi:hypothetical protein
VSDAVICQSAGGQMERDLRRTSADAEASLARSLDRNLASFGNSVELVEGSDRKSHFRVTSPSGHMVGEYWIEP